MKADEEDPTDRACELFQDKQVIMLKMKGNSMYPVLRAGDIGIVTKCGPEELRIGDIVVFKSANNYVAHRLVRLSIHETETVFITQGDKNPYEDIPFTSDAIKGKITTFRRKDTVKTVNDLSVRLQTLLTKRFKRIAIPYFNFLLLMQSWQKKIKNIFVSISKNMQVIGQGTGKQFACNAVFAVMQGILPFLLIVFMKLLVDALTNSSQQNHSLWGNQEVLLILTALTFLLNALITIIRTYYMEKLSHTVTHHTYELLHQKHSELDLSFYEDHNQQDKIHRAVQEASYRPVKIMGELLALVKSLTSMLVMLVLFASIQWYLVLLLIIAIVPSVMVRLNFSGKRYRLKKNQSPVEREMNYYSRILTGLPFAKELRLFGFSGVFLNRFKSIENKLYQENISLQRSVLRYDVLSQLFAVVLIFASLAYLVYLKSAGLITIGSVVLFFFVFQRGFSVFTELFQSLTKLVEDNTFLNDFMDFLTIPVKTKALGEKLSIPLKKGITVENVCFRYETSKREALSSVSLHIPAGKTVAFVGANGSGKTTMIKLLCGFYQPLKGAIRYDDTDLINLDKDALREQITAVFQDYALYNVSASENIGLGNIRQPFDQEKAKKAAEAAGIADILEHLPQGYQTILGTLFKSGEELSIGQWQKIALARAFYRDSPIIFMDEPSSALDVDSEKQLLNSLKKLGENKTVVIVSHRLSTVQWADIIYLFDKGRILESGSHQDLMTLRGAYYKIFQSVSGNEVNIKTKVSEHD